MSRVWWHEAGLAAGNQSTIFTATIMSLSSSSSYSLSSLYSLSSPWCYSLSYFYIGRRGAWAVVCWNYWWTSRQLQIIPGTPSPLSHCTPHSISDCDEDHAITCDFMLKERFEKSFTPTPQPNCSHNWTYFHFIFLFVYMSTYKCKNIAGQSPT